MQHYKNHITKNITFPKTQQYYKKHNITGNTSTLQKTLIFFVLSVVVCCMLLCFHLQGHTVVSASTQIN